MIDKDDGEMEFSPLCANITQGGLTMRVEIFRLPGRNRWSLAVSHHDSPPVVWSNDFATEQDACAEFRRALELEGAASLLEP
jgi:hypothetical protein